MADLQTPVSLLTICAVATGATAVCALCACAPLDAGSTLHPSPSLARPSPPRHPVVAPLVLRFGWAPLCLAYWKYRAFSRNLPLFAFGGVPSRVRSGPRNFGFRARPGVSWIHARSVLGRPDPEVDRNCGGWGRTRAPLANRIALRAAGCCRPGVT